MKKKLLHIGTSALLVSAIFSLQGVQGVMAEEDDNDVEVEEIVEKEEYKQTPETISENEDIQYASNKVLKNGLSVEKDDRYYRDFKWSLIINAEEDLMNDHTIVESEITTDNHLFSEFGTGLSIYTAVEAYGEVATDSLLIYGDDYEVEFSNSYKKMTIKLLKEFDNPLLIKYNTEATNGSNEIYGSKNTFKSEVYQEKINYDFHTELVQSYGLVFTWTELPTSNIPVKFQVYRNGEPYREPVAVELNNKDVHYGNHDSDAPWMNLPLLDENMNEIDYIVKPIESEYIKLEEATQGGSLAEAYLFYITATPIGVPTLNDPDNNITDENDIDEGNNEDEIINKPNKPDENEESEKTEDNKEKDQKEANNETDDSKESDAEKLPKTGDSDNIFAYATGFAFILVGLATFKLNKKRKYA